MTHIKYLKKQLFSILDNAIDEYFKENNINATGILSGNICINDDIECSVVNLVNAVDTFIDECIESNIQENIIEQSFLIGYVAVKKADTNYTVSIFNEKIEEMTKILSAFNASGKDWNIFPVYETEDKKKFFNAGFDGIVWM